MTWNSDGRFTLRSARASVSFRSGSGGSGQGRIIAPSPGSVLGEDGTPVRGHPEGRVDLAGFSLWLEKAWQRAPFALEWEGSAIDLWFYTPYARALGVSGGTSFRHSLELACGSAAAETAGQGVQVVIDPAHLCSCGALGMIADPLTARADFPGYEKSLRATLESGRLSRLSRASQDGGILGDGEPARLEREEEQDPDYFGLQHYGDWPMPWGSYGLRDRRMYASNEYDPAYAYFQGYALYGDWRYREVARYSAEHMTDVDIISTTGDMRFHGYNELAEDHELARSGGEYGHYWTDGYWMLSFLCGDLWAREAAIGVTELLVRKLSRDGEDNLRAIWAGAERQLGWPLVALMGSCEAAGGDSAPEMETIRRIVDFIDRFTADPDRDLEEEIGSAGVPVSSWRTAMQDGCKPFMVGVVLEGLERFHRLTGDERAGASIVRLARWLIDRMWLPHEATFVYEYNGYGRGHRLAKPHDLIPLFVRGLGYAYELSGEERIREVSEKAFHACLWTLYSPSSGGKSIGMMGRTLGAYVAMLDGWNRRDRARYRASIAPSAGSALAFIGGVAALLASGEVVLRRGEPRYDGPALVSEGESFVEGRFRRPLSTDSGEIAFRVWLAPGSTTFLNKRACLQLSDDAHTSAAVSIIIFYTGLHVRIYDERRAIIEVAEGFIRDVDAKGAPVASKTYPAWEEGEWHEVEARWRIPSTGRSGELELRIDSALADRRELDRAIGGRFTRISLGHKPGNWRLHGKLDLRRLLLG